MTDTSTKYDNYSLDDIYAEVEDLNNPEVLLGIAHHYKNGNDTKKDEEKYLSYLNQAIDAGSDKAQTELQEYKKDKTNNDQGKNDNHTISFDNANDMTLSGNEDMDELIRLSDNGNFLACYQLWQKAIEYHSDAEANIYLNRLIDYVTDGSTANKYKSDLAVKLGDYYRDKIDFKKYNSYEESITGKVTYCHRNDEDILSNINNSKKYYDIGRELGNKEATINLIKLLCNLEDPVAAEAIFRQSDILGSKDKSEILELLYNTYSKIGGFKLKMAAIVDEINKDPNISENRKHFINMCSEIDNHGWNYLFNNYTDSLYALNIKNHFSNKYRIKSLTLNEFQKMIYIYRNYYNDQLMHFLAMGVVYGSNEIQQYVFDNVEEFKNGSLMPEILKIQRESSLPDGFHEEDEKRKAIKARKKYIIPKYKSFREFIFDKKNAEYIKIFYDTPEDLKNLNDDDLLCLIQFYRTQHDSESLNNLICNAINDGKKSHYNIAVNINEFKNPEFILKNSDINVEKAHDEYIAKKERHNKEIFYLLIMMADIILYVFKLRTSALIYTNIIIFGTSIVFMIYNRNLLQEEEYRDEYRKTMFYALIYALLIIFNGFAMSSGTAIFFDAVLAVTYFALLLHI